MEPLSTCGTVLCFIRCKSKPPGDIAPTKSHPRQSVFFQSWKCPIRRGQRQIDAAANRFGSNRNICDIQKVKDLNPGPCCTKVGVIQGCRQSDAFNGCGWRKGDCRLFMTQGFLFVIYWCLWYFIINSQELESFSLCLKQRGSWQSWAFEDDGSGRLQNVVFNSSEAFASWIR